MARIFGPDVIYIIRAPLTLDSRDNSYYRDWANSTETEYNNCLVEPYRMAEKLNAEDLVDREFMQSAIRVFAPPDVDVLYTDRLRVFSPNDDYAGIEFQVLGLPGRWHDFDGKRVYKGIIAQVRLG